MADCWAHEGDALLLYDDFDFTAGEWLPRGFVRIDVSGRGVGEYVRDFFGTGRSLLVEPRLGNGPGDLIEVNESSGELTVVASLDEGETGWWRRDEKLLIKRGTEPVESATLVTLFVASPPDYSWKRASPTLEGQYHLVRPPRDGDRAIIYDGQTLYWSDETTLEEIGDVRSLHAPLLIDDRIVPKLWCDDGMCTYSDVDVTTARETVRAVTSTPTTRPTHTLLHSRFLACGTAEALVAAHFGPSELSLEGSLDREYWIIQLRSEGR